MTDDPYDLARFVDAQRGGVYERAFDEIRAGRKESHWMWFVFPQIAGLGSSAISVHFAIRSAAEARAYLDHPVLGARLRECAAALLSLEQRSAREIFGSPDDLKLRSSATLFGAVSPGEAVFHRILERYFDGRPDPRTLARLGEDRGSSPAPARPTP